MLSRKNFVAIEFGWDSQYAPKLTELGIKKIAILQCFFKNAKRCTSINVQRGTLHIVSSFSIYHIFFMRNPNFINILPRILGDCER